MQYSNGFKPVVASFLVGATLLLAACGNLTDKHRIVIAEMDGEPIRRGDLHQLIREMDDAERPIIRNRGDLLRVLNRHIDETILDELAFELRSERKIEVPRARALAVYFERHPDDRAIYEIDSAEELAEEDFDISEGQLNAFKADMEFKIDKVEQELLRDAALNYLIRDALERNALTITEEEFKNEYEIYQDQLFFFERIGFVGIRFMDGFGDAAKGAAECRARLDAGMSFEEVARIYTDINELMYIESTIENNPSLDRFKPFWDKASGAEVGDIIGPVYLPEYEVMEPLPDGTYKTTTQPAAYVVLRVEEYSPPRGKTWEEARSDLAPLILRRKMIRKLREDHGVKVYEENLPDPGRYDDNTESMFIDVE